MRTAPSPPPPRPADRAVGVARSTPAATPPNPRAPRRLLACPRNRPPLGPGTRLAARHSAIHPRPMPLPGYTAQTTARRSRAALVHPNRGKRPRSTPIRAKIETERREIGTDSPENRAKNRGKKILIQSPNSAEIREIKKFPRPRRAAREDLRGNERTDRTAAPAGCAGSPARAN